MTLAEFLAQEKQQDLHWEFDGIAPVAMHEVTIRHASTRGNHPARNPIRRNRGKTSPQKNGNSSI